MIGLRHSRRARGRTLAIGLIALCALVAPARPEFKAANPVGVAMTVRAACAARLRIARVVVLDAGQLRWWLGQVPVAIPPPAPRIIGPTASLGVYIRWSAGRRGDWFIVTLVDRSGRVIGATSRMPTAGESEDGFAVPINRPAALRPGVYAAIVTVDGCVGRRVTWLLAFGRRPPAGLPPLPPLRPASACERSPRSLLACIALAVVRIDACLSSTTESQGSGMVIAEDHSGTYVLTAAHVVAHARRGQIVVTTARGRVLRVQAVASLGGARPDSDVAVLRIADVRVPLVTRARVMALQPGERVLAVGYHALRAAPPTAAAGQLLAAGVDVADGAGPVYLLHTALLLPGDSGGPLYAQDSGQVIGMDVAMLGAQPGRRAHQVGLSLPMSAVWPLAARLMARLHP